MDLNQKYFIGCVENRDLRLPFCFQSKLNRFLELLQTYLGVKSLPNSKERKETVRVLFSK